MWYEYQYNYINLQCYWPRTNGLASYIGRSRSDVIRNHYNYWHDGTRELIQIASCTIRHYWCVVRGPWSVVRHWFPIIRGYKCPSWNYDDQDDDDEIRRALVTNVQWRHPRSRDTPLSLSLLPEELPNSSVRQSISLSAVSLFVCLSVCLSVCLIDTIRISVGLSFDANIIINIFRWHSPHDEIWASWVRMRNTMVYRLLSTFYTANVSISDCGSINRLACRLQRGYFSNQLVVIRLSLCIHFIAFLWFKIQQILCFQLQQQANIVRFVRSKLSYQNRSRQSWNKNVLNNLLKLNE